MPKGVVPNGSIVKSNSKTNNSMKWNTPTKDNATTSTTNSTTKSIKSINFGPPTWTSSSLKVKKTSWFFSPNTETNASSLKTNSTSSWAPKSRSLLNCSTWGKWKNKWPNKKITSRPTECNKKLKKCLRTKNKSGSRKDPKKSRKLSTTWGTSRQWNWRTWRRGSRRLRRTTRRIITLRFCGSNRSTRTWCVIWKLNRRGSHCHLRENSGHWEGEVQHHLPTDQRCSQLLYEWWT